MMTRAVFMFIASLLLISCGNSTPTSPSSGLLALTGFETVVDSGLTRSSTSIAGTGTLRYAMPIATGDQKVDHKLTFSLTDGGKLTWITFAASSMASGVEYEFSRTGASLALRLLLNGGSATSVFTLSGIDASTTISLYLESHNSEAPAHLMVFPGATTSFIADNAAFNSEGSGSAAPGNGGGLYYGVKLENATLTAVETSAAKFAE